MILVKTNCPYKGWRCHSFALQEAYVEEVTNTHGEGFDWENALVDGQVVYVSGGGKAHGW
jgi:hypothetical protein